MRDVRQAPIYPQAPCGERLAGGFVMRDVRQGRFLDGARDSFGASREAS